MKDIRQILDPFLAIFAIFIIVNVIFIVNSTYCVELTTVFLLLFIIPIVSIFSIILNVLYAIKKKPMLIQVLRYLNFILIVAIMAYYWLIYNTCNTFGNSIS